MWLTLGLAWAQPQVWKCEVEGQVRYTDQPCEKSGQPMPARSLQPNGVDNAASAASAAIPAEPPASTADGAIGRQVRAAPAALNGSRGSRGARAPAVAMWGLMNTDFVQRGRPFRRQNPASTPNAEP